MSKTIKQRHLEAIAGCCINDASANHAAERSEAITEDVCEMFIKWQQNGMWHRYGNGEDLSHYHPSHRGDDRYRFNGLWYNTINIIEMKKPLKYKELWDIFKQENGL